MKIYFKPDDTIFKIFSTLEKLKTSKIVEIYIPYGSSFYENNWWIKQLIKILDKNGINYIFIADLKTESFYKSQNVPYKLKNTFSSLFIKKINNLFKKLIYLHTTILNPKNYIGKIIILLEIIIILSISYGFYKLISFQADIYIKPTKNIETIIYSFIYYPYGKNEKYEKLAIPYLIGSGTYEKQLSLKVKNIQYLTKPSKGKIKILNFTNKKLDFVANTKFITQDGLLFKSDTRFSIPPKIGNKPGETIISITAMEKDINGKIIGIKGNIKKGTKLYILKYPLSKDKKLIIAEALKDFTGGETNSKGIISKEDIDILQNKLKEYIEKYKLSIAISLTKKLYPEYLLLDFPELINYKIVDIQIDSKPGEKKTVINGTIIANFNFHIINYNDIKKSIINYLKQRDLDILKIDSIPKENIKFLEFNKITDKIFLITTQFDVIRNYNFETDENELIKEIKFKITGKTKLEAENIILSYPEISSVDIRIYPPWYDILPNLKSKINIKILK